MIPKNPGTIDNFPNCLIRSDLHTVTIKITNDRVDPPPPKLQKKLLNGFVKIYGNALPASNAINCFAVNTLPMKNTELHTAGPLIPKNQKKVHMNEYNALAPNVSPKPSNGVCRMATTKSWKYPNSVNEKPIRTKNAAPITRALGTNAANESATAGGTPLGILIVHPFL